MCHLLYSHSRLVTTCSFLACQFLSYEGFLCRWERLSFVCCLLSLHHFLNTSCNFPWSVWQFMSRSAAIVLGCGGFPESLLSSEKRKRKRSQLTRDPGGQGDSSVGKAAAGRVRVPRLKAPAPNKSSDLSTGVYNPRGPLRGRESFDLAQNMKRKKQQRSCLTQEVSPDIQGSPLSSTWPEQIQTHEHTCIHTRVHTHKNKHIHTQDLRDLSIISPLKRWPLATSKGATVPTFVPRWKIPLQHEASFLVTS